MTRRISFLLCVLALAGLGATACGRYLTTGVAVVNGVSITKTDLDKALTAQFQDPQNASLKDPRSPQEIDARKSLELTAIRSLIQQELTRQEAERLDVKVTNADVERAFGQVRSQFPTEQDFQQALAQGGITAGSLRDRVRSQLFLQGMADKVAPDVQPTEQELRLAYGNGARFEEFRVRHILFQFTQTGDEAAVRAKAAAALEKLKAGADFATLAKQVSEDPGSKAAGGDLGVVTRDTNFDADFLAAALALKPGQLSGLVRTQFGFHIIRVDSKTTKTFEQVRAQLAKEIGDQKKQQAFEGYFAGRLNAATIVVNPRWGDFDKNTLDIKPHQFFTPPSSEPSTQPLPPGA